MVLQVLTYKKIRVLYVFLFKNTHKPTSNAKYSFNVVFRIKRKCKKTYKLLKLIFF